MPLQVFAIDNDIDNLLLIDGRTVVNGAFTIVRHRNGTISHKGIIANHIYDVPTSWRATDYNVILERVRRLSKKKCPRGRMVRQPSSKRF